MDRKRKRQSGVEYWTASKCQRLLRPIASRIAPLRRNQYTINSESLQTDSRENALPIAKLQMVPGTEPAGSGINATILDPTWLPSDQSRRCQLKKYSVRNRDSQAPTGQIESPRACLVFLPTPFKARALRRGTPIKQGVHLETSNSPCALKTLPLTRKVRQRKDPFTRAPIAKQSIELQGRQNYERTFELHQGVTDGFSLLLQRTVPLDVEQLPSRGASSLLSMCLRKVPDYIQAEEHWRRSIDEDDDTDVSAEVYEELEGLGSVQGHGWPGLREVVVAHGLKLIHEIIKDKLVATETRAELAKIPSRHGLHRESQDLLLAYAHSLPLKRPLGVDSRLFDGCLSSLTAMQPASARNEVFVRTLDALFSSGRLKLSWLATRDMVTLSSGMVRALASQSEHHEHALNFLQGRISQISTAELVGHGVTRQGPEGKLDVGIKLEKSLTNTTVSIITVLTAMVLIERNSRSFDEGPGRPTATESLLVCLSINVLANLAVLEQRDGDIHSKNDTKIPQNTVCFALLASSLILSLHQDATKSDHMSLRRQDIVQAMILVHGRTTPDRAETVVERAASFLVDLSRCCGQSLHSDSQTYLEGLVSSIFQESRHGSDPEKTFLKQWAMESSLHFAEISATQRSRALLENIEAAMAQHSSLGIKKTGVGSQQIRDIVAEPGLRWEEGLCEWIVASPVHAKKPRNITALSNKTRSKSPSDEESELDDSGYLSDNKATPAPRQKFINMSHMLASPDVLGMEPRMLSGATTSLQDTARNMQTPQGPAVPKQRTENSNAVEAVSKIPDNVNHPTPPHESLIDLTGNPAKRRKSQKAKQASLGAPSLVHKSSQDPAPPSTREQIEKAHGDLSGNDIDELAMSCSNPRQTAAFGRKIVPCKSSARVSLPIRRTSSQIDISDDELGF